MNDLPNPNKLTMTIGVMNMQKKDEPEGDYLFQPTLAKAVKEQFEKEPDKCTDGGNDKYFFSMMFRNVKLFVAANEVNGLTIMLPEEY
jgi:hypothetical protein